MPLTILDHPLANHFLTQLRDRNTGSSEFRITCHRLTTFLIIEATKDLPVVPRKIATPLESFEGVEMENNVVVVPVLRAGLGMLQMVADLIPNLSVGYVGLERDHETAEAHSYYCKLPEVENRLILLVDPMLATGGSAEVAIERLVKRGANSLKFLCMVASPEGVERLQRRFPELEIITVALDRELNEDKYILPGLGDCGDRLYGTT
jgi:uracil phosphoribosyltransferase